MTNFVVISWIYFLLFVGFFFMGLVLKWWRLYKTVEFVTSSRLARIYSTHEAHMRSTYWKLKSLLCQCISWVTRDLAKSRSDPQNALTCELSILFCNHAFHNQNNSKAPTNTKIFLISNPSNNFAIRSISQIKFIFIFLIKN